MPDILDKTVRTPVGDAPVIPALIIVFGAYLCWFGVHYWRSDTPYPTDPLKAVLTGRPIPTPDRSTGEAAISSLVAGAQGGAQVPAGAGGASDPGASASVMTKEQIKALWTANGGSASTARIAAAIAMAESSGRVTITSPNPDGGTNVGLWQLDTKGAGAGYTVGQLQAPATNARITVLKSANGTSWGPWEVWHTGAYKDYL